MNKEFTFQITNIDLLEATLNPQIGSLEENQVFNYDINLEHKININEQVLIVVCRVIITSENQEEIFGKYKAGCIFKIDNLKDFTNQEDENKLDLPNNLVVTLNSISISTIRGMMASFYRGTYLHNAILPIINPTSFNNENAKN